MYAAGRYKKNGGATFLRWHRQKHSKKTDWMFLFRTKVLRKRKRQKVLKCILNCIIIRVQCTKSVCVCSHHDKNDHQHRHTQARNTHGLRGLKESDRRDVHFSVDAMLLPLNGCWLRNTVTVTNLNHCTPYFECISQNQANATHLLPFLSFAVDCCT